MRGSLLRIIKSYQRLAPLKGALVAVIAAVLLSACSQPSDVIENLNRFNQRVANTLNTEPADLSYSPRPSPMPSVRELKPTAERAGMSFLTSLRLSHCRAGHLIAQRNSSLGRLEDGLMRYQDDIAILVALKQCVDQPQSALIRHELIQAIADKSQQLDVNKAHAVATDKALRHALTIGNQPLTSIDQSAFISALTALTQITHWLERQDTQHRATDSELSVWREHLAQSAYLPRLMRTTVEMYLKLQQLQQQLPPLSKAAGCNSKGVPERAHILRNVFIKFFIAAVQTDLAQLTTQYRQLSPVLLRLARQVPQPALKRYLIELSTYGQRLSHSSKRFVQPWQHVFTDCNFTPGVS